jgi:hypothetical protein
VLPSDEETDKALQALASFLDLESPTANEKRTAQRAFGNLLKQVKEWRDLAQVQGALMKPLTETVQLRNARIAELEAVESLQRYLTVDDKPLWRVGRKVGRTVYCGDTLVGMFDTKKYALAAVAALNSLSGKAGT